MAKYIDQNGATTFVQALISNTKTVGGQSIWGNGNISAGGSECVKITTWDLIEKLNSFTLQPGTLYAVTDYGTMDLFEKCIQVTKYSTGRELWVRAINESTLDPVGYVVIDGTNTEGELAPFFRYQLPPDAENPDIYKYLFGFLVHFNIVEDGGGTPWFHVTYMEDGNHNRAGFDFVNFAPDLTSLMQRKIDFIGDGLTKWWFNYLSSNFNPADSTNDKPFFISGWCHNVDMTALRDDCSCWLSGYFDNVKFGGNNKNIFLIDTYFLANGTRWVPEIYGYDRINRNIEIEAGVTNVLWLPCDPAQPSKESSASVNYGAQSLNGVKITEARPDYLGTEYPNNPKMYLTILLGVHNVNTNSNNGYRPSQYTNVLISLYTMQPEQDGSFIDRIYRLNASPTYGLSTEHLPKCFYEVIDMDSANDPLGMACTYSMAGNFTNPGTTVTQFQTLYQKGYGILNGEML